MQSYNNYRKVTSALCKFTTKSELIDNPRQYSYLARHDKTAMELLMKAPLSDSIINPVPEPVDFASREQMQPLYEWLETENKTGWMPNFNEEDLKFIKGVVTVDGRLDLCKQVIGPQGIEPLLEVLKCSNKVNRVLLGNNIIGDEGGGTIANFIKSGKSQIKIWYIAGNHFTSKGIEPILEALVNDTQVTGLWLKRNPLKIPSTIPISNFLAHNRTLQVLDILNCGIMDEGVEVLCKGLAKNTTLRHLYLTANGIGPRGLNALKDYYSGGNSQLVSLFLGCNRVGNEGAKIVGDILKFDSKLERLNLSSSRIGAEGMKGLCEGLIQNKSIKMLDLGFMRATMDLGELGNYIEDEGAEYLCEFISSSSKLASLSITYNHISEYGIQSIAAAISKSKSMILFEYVQYGVALHSVDAHLIREGLRENRTLYTEDELNEIEIPEHVRDIHSVYRTH